MRAAAARVRRRPPYPAPGFGSLATGAAAGPPELVLLPRQRDNDGHADAAPADPRAPGYVGSVLIIVQNLPVPFDRRVWLECQTLVAAGYQVSVICPKGPGDPPYQLLEGVHLYKYPPAPPTEGFVDYVTEFAWSWLATAWLSVKVWRREGFDVIQACNPPDTYWALALPYKLFGKRFVYDQHDLCPEVYTSRFRSNASPKVLRALRGLERMTYAVADRVVSTNESYKRHAIDQGRLDSGSVTVVRSGPDTTRMAPGLQHPELLAGHEHLVCYLGVMGPQDGVDGLLHMWNTFVHDLGRKDALLALLGFGDSVPQLKALTEELGLTDHVVFAGRADPAMISAYLSTASVGVCPDPPSPLNNVSTMNKVMEYMAFGLPVVGFDLHESKVSAGDAGVFLAGGDVNAMAATVAALLDDHEERARLGGLARARAAGVLDWRWQAPHYIRVFDGLRGAARDLVVFPHKDGSGRFHTARERRAAERRAAPRRAAERDSADRRAQPDRRDAAFALIDAAFPPAIASPVPDRRTPPS